MPFACSLRPTALVTAVVLTAGAAGYLGLQYLQPVLSLSLAAFGALVGGLSVIWLLPDSRMEAIRLWSDVRKAGFRGFLPLIRGGGIAPKTTA